VESEAMYSVMLWEYFEMLQSAFEVVEKKRDILERGQCFLWSILK